MRSLVTSGGIGRSSLQASATHSTWHREAALSGGCRTPRPSFSTPHARQRSPRAASSRRSDNFRSASSPRMVSSMPSPAQGPTSVSQASPRNIRCAAARRAQPDRAGASRAVSRHRTGCEITDRPRKADGPAAATGRSCADGIAGQTIATRLGIFEKTVGNHFRGMYKRAGHQQAQLADRSSEIEQGIGSGSC
jgi:hypothetical protein